MNSRSAITLPVLFSLSVALVAAQNDLRATVKAWVDSHQQQIVKELVELLAIPNVAADRPNIRRNADHLRGMLAARGFDAEVLETDGNPLVYGDLRVAGATRTLLLYSHYDGQPVDARAWKQPDPFVPVLRTARVDQAGKDIPDISGQTRFEPDWRIYARSASDDKAPIVAVCAALDALKAAGLTPTWNVRVILDGEEEASSPSLVPAIARYRDKLRADFMVILDGPIHSSARPTIAYGARGIVTLNLTVYRAEGRRPQRELRQLGAEPCAAARGAAGDHEDRRGEGAGQGILRRDRPARARRAGASRRGAG